MSVLVTGSAGFIGFHTAAALLRRGEAVMGVDCVNDYYDPQLKERRLEILGDSPAFSFERVDISDAERLSAVFDQYRPRRVINLAAQAGVRYSVENPAAYVASNLVGFANVLECCRQHKVEHLVYASTSSVYGANQKMPFGEEQGVNHPLSLYAATKRSNELMAHSYAHLFNLPCTGLRFFTVYGPWGRPDMALFKFTKAMLEGRPIDVYNNGDMKRDFTYIDDIVRGVVGALDTIPSPRQVDHAALNPNPSRSAVAPFAVYNIGRGQTVQLMDFIRAIETELGVAATFNMMPMQPGDVSATASDTSALEGAAGVVPSTGVDEGIAAFVRWYRDYYGV